MKNLKQKWTSFWGIVLGPGSAIFTILTVASLFLSVYFQSNTEVSVLLAVLGSAFGGIAGGFIRDDYNKIVGENILEKKGLSAIRNLKSIERQLVNIRVWVKDFCKERTTKEQKSILNEIDRHLSTTQLNIQSGFDDWVDMVPELAQEAERAAEITKKQQEVLQAYVGELLEKKKELVISKDEEQTSKLKKRISVLEKEIKDLRTERSQESGVLSLSAIGGTGAVSGYRNNFIFAEAKCANCGKDLGQRNISDPGVINVYSPYCDDCKNKLF